MTASEENTLNICHEVTNIVADLEAVESLMSMDKISFDGVRAAIRSDATRLRAILSVLRGYQHENSGSRRQ